MYLICSAGGVGTTAFIDWLSQYKETNDSTDRDHLKHLTSPILDKNVEKAVYLFTRRPEEQAVSLVKRFENKQIKKLTGENLPVKKPSDLKLYDYDVFDFKNVFRSWWFCNVDYSIAFVNYDIMWNRLEEIGYFLGLTDKINTFPEKKQRQETRKILNTDKELSNHLNGIYKDYKELLSNMPDFYIVEPPK